MTSADSFHNSLLGTCEYTGRRVFCAIRLISGIDDVHVVGPRRMQCSDLANIKISAHTTGPSVIHTRGH